MEELNLNPADLTLEDHCRFFLDPELQGQFFNSFPHLTSLYDSHLAFNQPFEDLELHNTIADALSSYSFLSGINSRNVVKIQEPVIPGRTSSPSSFLLLQPTSEFRERQESEFVNNPSGNNAVARKPISGGRKRKKNDEAQDNKKIQRTRINTKKKNGARRQKTLSTYNSEAFNKSSVAETNHIDTSLVNSTAPTDAYLLTSSTTLTVADKQSGSKENAVKSCGSDTKRATKLKVKAIAIRNVTQPKDKGSEPLNLEHLEEANPLEANDLLAEISTNMKTSIDVALRQIGTDGSTNEEVVSSEANSKHPAAGNCSAAEDEEHNELGVRISEMISMASKAVTEKLDVSVHVEESQCVMLDGRRRWKCLQCPKVYSSKHNLVTHVLGHSGIKPHCCVVCGRYFKQLSHLQTHMLTHAKIKPHVCGICKKRFTQVSHLKRHSAIHLQSKPHVCDECHRGFAYPNELKSHKERHRTEADHVCVECGATFDSLGLMRRHKSVEHKMTDGALRCQRCDRSFRYPSQLRDHTMKHDGKRPHICKECGMDFLKEHHLKAHLFTHTGLRPFTCDVCGRSFSQKANLQRHAVIHDGTKRYPCTMCGKSFSQPQILRVHLVTHQETKPYQCTICGKGFSRLHNLNGHLHGHNGDTPFVCSCGSTFTLRGNLNRHRKDKHCSSPERSNNITAEEEESSEIPHETETETAEQPKKKRKSLPSKHVAAVTDGEDVDKEFTDMWNAELANGTLDLLGSNRAEVMSLPSARVTWTSIDGETLSPPARKLYPGLRNSSAKQSRSSNNSSRNNGVKSRSNRKRTLKKVIHNKNKVKQQNTR